MEKGGKQKIIVILGPNASGKSGLAVKLAKKFSARGGPASGWNGAEIISADSRQVYKGLDIGSGKITKREMAGIPHHLLDVANPKKVFSVADFQKLARKKLRSIEGKGKLPIIVGGTGFYIQSIVGGIVLPEVKPNKALRKKLENKSTQELFAILKKLDSRRAKLIDKNNPRRLTRAIEIAKALGKNPKLKKEAKYDCLQIGIGLTDKVLKKKIHDRLLARMRQGLIAEVKKLHKQGASWKRLNDLGLEYRFVTEYLRGNLEKNEMLEKLEKAIWQFAKRQRTWFKRDKKIIWVKPNETRRINQLVENFLSGGSTRPSTKKISAR